MIGVESELKEKPPRSVLRRLPTHVPSLPSAEMTVDPWSVGSDPPPVRTPVTGGWVGFQRREVFRAGPGEDYRDRSLRRKR